MGHHVEEGDALLVQGEDVVGGVAGGLGLPADLPVTCTKQCLFKCHRKKIFFVKKTL